MKYPALFNKILCLIAIIITVPIIGFFPSIGIIYYVVLSISFIFFVYRSKKIKVNYLCLTILLAFFLSILIGNPPSVFRSWERFGAFLILFSFVSPLFYNNELIENRNKIFLFLLEIMVLITLCSFIGSFLGINYELRPNAPFSGITVHSMILSPIAGISSLFLCSKLLMKGTSRSKLLLFVICYFVSIYVMILSGSRAAIISCLIGHLFMLRKVKHKISILIVGLISILSMISINPKVLDAVNEKNEHAMETNGNLMSSRDAKWKARQFEFTTSPLFGIGFSSILIETLDKYDHETGIIEPGSSWLGLFSMTGLFGGFSVLLLFSLAIYKVVSQRYTIKNDQLLCADAVLVFFIVHMFAEGYFLAAGSYMALVAWLTLSVVYSNYSIQIHH